MAAMVLRQLEAFVVGVMVLLLSAWLLGVALHLRILSIQTNSMQPTFSAGDAVVVRKINYRLSVGDIVAYKSLVHGQTITHRVRAITDSQIVTQGDAADTADAPIPSKQVTGQAILVISALGRILTLLHNPIWLLLVLGTAIVLVLSAEITALSQRVSTLRYSIAYRK